MPIPIELPFLFGDLLPVVVVDPFVVALLKLFMPF
jgi:hypothetical protein